MNKAYGLGNSAVSNLEVNSTISDFSSSSQSNCFYPINLPEERNGPKKQTFKTVVLS